MSSTGNWKDPEPQWRLVKKRGGDWMTVQDVTHEIMTTTLNFKQMVNVLNLNIKNNSLVGININILILSMT